MLREGLQALAVVLFVILPASVLLALGIRQVAHNTPSAKTCYGLGGEYRVGPYNPASCTLPTGEIVDPLRWESAQR